MKRIKSILKKIGVSLFYVTAVLLIISGIVFSIWADSFVEKWGTYEAEGKKATTTIQERVDPLEVEIRAIMNTPEFKQRAREEAETIYWKGVIEQAGERLEELDGGGFWPDAMKETALREFLGEHNPSLVAYSREIMELPRWQEVLAIAVHETQLCKVGVGRQNNCGGIKRGDGGFKVYTTAFDGLEDISVLLQKPRYRDLTIAEMNSIYCVHEEGPTGVGPCPNWTENVEKYKQELALLTQRAIMNGM